MTKHVADYSFLGELCLCRGLSGPGLTQISPLSSKEISECELRARCKPSLELWFGGKFKSCSFLSRVQIQRLHTRSGITTRPGQIRTLGEAS